eukprot:scaffold179288_cov22-Tisochrysis_lutea.AAC.1
MSSTRCMLLGAPSPLINDLAILSMTTPRIHLKLTSQDAHGNEETPHVTSRHLTSHDHPEKGSPHTISSLTSGCIPNLREAALDSGNIGSNGACLQSFVLTL